MAYDSSSANKKSRSPGSFTFSTIESHCWISVAEFPLFLGKTLTGRYRLLFQANAWFFEVLSLFNFGQDTRFFARFLEAAKCGLKAFIIA